MALRPSVAEDLALGQQLYNARRFWEAHDAWEQAWLAEEGDAKRMFQGLIQVAAGYHNAFVRRRAGAAAKQIAAGLEKLVTIPDALGGLSLAAFREAVARTLEEVRRWQRGERGELLPADAPALLSAP